MIPIILILQIPPLVVFPASSFSLTTQEWWLPLVLSLLTLLALIQLIFRHSVASWPWYLLAFSQGFNIISRLMMLLPHATVSNENGVSANGKYLIIAFTTMLFSVFELWYCELPEVRQKLAARSRAKPAA
jgi:hypothetical protein